MRNCVARFLDECLTTLFPRVCPLCKHAVLRSEEAFCSVCLSSFQLVRLPVCLRCGEPLEEIPGSPATLCARCLFSSADFTSSLPATRSTTIYEGPIRTAILEVKYSGGIAMASSLGTFLQQQFGYFFPGEVFDAIVPVPLHVLRMRARGFNQSFLLARPLAKHLAVPLEIHSVEKVIDTPPQSGSSPTDRRKNLRDAFSVSLPYRIRGRSLLIVDDVFTTGSTILSLAKALLAAGAHKVSAFTLARSRQPPPT